MIVKKLILKFLIIKTVNIKEMIKNKIKYNLFFKSDLIQFNCGPIAMNIKNGIKKGMMSLWKKGGPTDIFSEVITSKKIG